MKRAFAALIFLSLSQFAMADNLDVTCRTLGDIGQCSSVSICKERSEGLCIPKAADRHNPEWINACASAGPTAQMCGWQIYCQWEEQTRCVPLRR